MSNAMKFIQPVLGAGETAVGAFTGNPALVASGVSTFGTGIMGDLASQQQSKLPQLSPTQPVATPDLSSIFGGIGGGGLSGDLASMPSQGGGSGGMGSGPTFGSTGSSFGGGGGGNGNLLSMILQRLLAGGAA